MATKSFLVLLFIWSINPFLAEDEEYSNYSFILDTSNQDTSNLTTKIDDIISITGLSFINAIAKTFSIDADDFVLHINDMANNSNDTPFSVTVTLEPFIGSKLPINLLFEAYVSIKDWHFEEYIYYRFLQRSISLELNNSDNDMDITLQNLTWFGHYQPQCIRNITDSESWKIVTQSLFKDIYYFLTWMFIAMLGLSCCIVIIGYIHSWIVWNEDIVIGNAIFFCFATFDWYSDILFTFSIPVEYISLWLISFCLLLIPLIGNVVWLVSQQRTWEQDAAIGARIKAWLVRWRPFLYSITIISGSAFGSINICNSNMLGYPLFRMGLRNIHLEKFDSKRLFITVLGENAPQLILQGFYWFYMNENFFSNRFSENKVTLTLAMISGIISILYAFGVIYSQKATLARFNDNEEELFEFNVVSSTDWPTKDKRKNRAYKYKIYPLRKAFASLLQIELAYVELHPPIKIEFGYQLRFTLMVKDMGGNQVALQTLRDLIEYREIAEKIQDVWKLDTLPRIEELKWKKDRKRDYQENMVLLQHNSVVGQPEVKKDESQNMSQNSFSYAQMSKKRYFAAPDPSAVKLPEAVAPAYPPADYSATMKSNQSVQIQSPNSKQQWVAMSSFSQSNSHMKGNAQQAPVIYRNKSAESALYRIVRGTKSKVKEEKIVEDGAKPNIIKQASNSQSHSHRIKHGPPPPPANVVENKIVDDSNKLHLEDKVRGFSTGSVGSEAAFQQQLFNHIRNQNTASTRDLNKKV